MKSLFNQTDNAEFIDRIDKFTPSASALWGKMNVAQMLSHCQLLYKINMGEVQLKQVFLGLIFGKMAKKQLLSDAPIKKNLPTFKQALVKGQRNFDDEKKTLKELVKRMGTTGPEGLTKNPHPFFGSLTAEE